MRTATIPSPDRTEETVGRIVVDSSSLTERDRDDRTLESADIGISETQGAATVAPSDGENST